MIDFGNASFGRSRGESSDVSQRSLIDADIGALRRLLGCITFGSSWHGPIFKVLEACTDAALLGKAVEQCLFCVARLNNADRNSFTAAHFEEMLKRWCMVSMFRSGPYPLKLRGLIQECAERFGLESTLAEVTEKLAARIVQEPNFIKFRAQLTAERADVDAALGSLLEPEG